MRRGTAPRHPIEVVRRHPDAVHEHGVGRQRPNSFHMGDQRAAVKIGARHRLDACFQNMRRNGRPRLPDNCAASCWKRSLQRCGPDTEHGGADSPGPAPRKVAPNRKHFLRPARCRLSGSLETVGEQIVQVRDGLVRRSISVGYADARAQPQIIIGPKDGVDDVMIELQAEVDIVKYRGGAAT